MTPDDARQMLVRIDHNLNLLTGYQAAHLEHLKQLHAEVKKLAVSIGLVGMAAMLLGAILAN